MNENKVDEANDSEIIKGLCSVINDQQKREDELMETIKDLIEENAKLRRKKSIFRKLFM